MLILQILVIPIVVLLMVSMVFIIASLGLEMPRYITRKGQSTLSLDGSDPTQLDDNPSPGVPFMEI